MVEEGHKTGFRWRIEARPHRSWWLQLFSLFAALFMAFLVSAVLLISADADVLEAFEALFSGAFGGRRQILESMVRAAPLILTGLSAAFAFRGKVWNIGAEGQLFAGAMASYWAFTVVGSLPPGVIFLCTVIAGFLGGAIWGWIAGALKARLNVDEIISTVMLNYIILFFLSFMLSGSGPWRQEGSFYQQSAEIPEAAHFPVLVSDSRLHAGFLIAVLAAMLVYVLLRWTPLGFEIRGIGFNPTALRFRGTDVPRLVVVVMTISGGIAGLAGAGELLGIHHRMVLDLSTGLGYTGIIVAMLAGLQPLGVVLAAILFGGLVNGAFRLQIATGVPSAFIFAIQAIVLLFVISASVLSRYRVRRIRDAE
jgi:simple sugar transport system permease protein